MDRCPNCNNRLDLRLEPMQFENDDTPEKKTVAYEVQSQICNNKQCANFEKVLDTIRTRRD